MAKIIYISGGERSGKSSYAQSIALEYTDSPIYLATSRVWDEDFKDRVKKHQDDRDGRWTNIEEDKLLSNTEISGKVVIIDCITLWLANWYTDLGNNIDKCLNACKNELEKLFRKKCTLIIISNEIGMGVHAQTEVGRKFVELQGWINQFIAQKAESAIFMVSGLPIKVK